MYLSLSSCCCHYGVFLGASGHKKRAPLKADALILKIVDKFGAHSHLKMEISRLNSGFSQGLPSYPALSHVSQISCLRTVPLLPRAPVKEINRQHLQNLHIPAILRVNDSLLDRLNGNLFAGSGKRQVIQRSFFPFLLNRPASSSLLPPSLPFFRPAAYPTFPFSP